MAAGWRSRSEYILRSTNIPTVVIPDVVDGPDCTIGETKDIKLTLHRMADGAGSSTARHSRTCQGCGCSSGSGTSRQAQGKDAGDVPADFRSPYAMFHTFIDAFKNGDLDAAAECLDLTDVPDPARQIVGQGAGVQAQGGSRPVDLPDLPGPPGLLGRASRWRRWCTRRGGSPRSGKSRAAQGSMAVQPGHGPVSGPALRRIRVEAPGPRAGRDRPDGPSCRRSASPGIVAASAGSARAPVPCRSRRARSRWRCINCWGWSVLVLLFVPVYRLVVWPLTRLAPGPDAPAGRAATDDRELAVVGPPARLAGRRSGCSSQGVTILDLRMEAAGALLAVLVPVFWLAAALAAYQLIDPLLKLIAGPALTQEGATTLAAMGFPVLSLVLKILVVACGLAAVLTLFDFDVGTVLAGLGIGGLAFALAAQDTLKNFFGSLMLIADRTFRVGTWSRSAGTRGWSSRSDCGPPGSAGSTTRS